MTAITLDLLVVQCHAPYASATANEGLDLALASAAFEKVTGILFQGDGVYQLLAEQSPDGIHQKNLSKVLSATPIYGVQHLFVSATCLQERKLSFDHLISRIELTPVSIAQAKELVRGAAHVMRF